jgi:hypothetical protein
MYCNKTTKTFEPMEDVLEHARHDAHELMAVDSGCPLDPMAVDDDCWAPPVASPQYVHPVLIQGPTPVLS